MKKIDKTWTLFLDRDGVLNAKIQNGYVLDPAMLQILPGVGEALASLSGVFGRIVVVTNQRGIARGQMSTDDLEAVHAALISAVSSEGGRIDQIFVCPHGIDDGCSCRKPRIGLALQAQAQFPEIDFSKSILVGDSGSDIEMGRALGMFTIHIVPDMGEVLGDLACTSLVDIGRLFGNV